MACLWICLLSSGCTLPDASRLWHGNSAHEQVVHVDARRRPEVARRLTAKAADYLAEQDYEAAAPLLQRALQADRTYPGAHNNLGLLHMADRDLFRAALEFQEAMKFAPEDPTPQNNLGLAFETAGRMHSAIDHYQAAHDLAPTNPQFLGNLIRARLRAGEPVQALRPELQQLRFIETRPGWIRWIEEQLELVTNPNLDRGPAAPDLPQLGSAGDSTEWNEEERILYDSGPVEDSPVENRPPEPAERLIPRLPPPPAGNPVGTDAPDSIQPAETSRSTDRWQAPVRR